jgi:hypothetical protein
MRPLRQLLEPSCHASVLDLLCFTKSSGEPKIGVNVGTAPEVKRELLSGACFRCSRDLSFCRQAACIRLSDT